MEPAETEHWVRQVEAALRVSRLLRTANLRHPTLSEVQTPQATELADPQPRAVRWRDRIGLLRSRSRHPSVAGRRP